MYQAKLAGKGRYHIFDSDLARNIKHQHEEIERLKQAVSNNEFVLHYQPKVNMRTAQVFGVEALIRWQHPKKACYIRLTSCPSLKSMHWQSILANGLLKQHCAS
nr:EAL domain-containing protein [Aliamphritea spongicola]